MQMPASVIASGLIQRARRGVLLSTFVGLAAGAALTVAAWRYHLELPLQASQLAGMIVVPLLLGYLFYLKERLAPRKLVE